MRIVDIRETPSERRGRWGVGAVHHLAWRVDDDQHQLAVRTQVENGGANATPVIDRFWFKSVYFKEPGGVLFELATDGPGFAVDEDPAHIRIRPLHPAHPLPVPVALRERVLEQVLGRVPVSGEQVGKARQGLLAGLDVVREVGCSSRVVHERSPVLAHHGCGGHTPSNPARW